MATYFATHERERETVATILLFLSSILFAAFSYEEVFDLHAINEGLHENSDKPDQEIDADARTKWKAEYAHPLVVRRNRQLSQVRKIVEVN